MKGITGFLLGLMLGSILGSALGSRRLAYRPREEEETPDKVDLASELSFPASDAPAY